MYIFMVCVLLFLIYIADEAYRCVYVNWYHSSFVPALNSSSPFVCVAVIRSTFFFIIMLVFFGFQSETDEILIFRMDIFLGFW